MNWYVFNREDPETWPELNCPMLVYYDLLDTLYICKWDNDINKFFEEVDCDKRFLHHFKECFYSYIGYIPNGYKVLHPVRCLNDDNCKIGCADDGYCMYDFCKCEQQKVINEYVVDTKRIWKEF